ncbi:unnamed protein product [Protopolystoma xenopodis]|uniref:Uncharacterized protein n=1 Tax=Protopolystoma xenopodis TaxID=117903 RepID=A0A3S5BCM3_9PLAT|nr:unnamed protein product [Protopolystoma xenopodis]
MPYNLHECELCQAKMTLCHRSAELEVNWTFGVRSHQKITDPTSVPGHQGFVELSTQRKTHLRLQKRGRDELCVSNKMLSAYARTRACASLVILPIPSTPPDLVCSEGTRNLATTCCWASLPACATVIFSCFPIPREFVHSSFPISFGLLISLTRFASSPSHIPLGELVICCKCAHFETVCKNITDSFTTDSLTLFFLSLIISEAFAELCSFAALFRQRCTFSLILCSPLSPNSTPT